MKKATSTNKEVSEPATNGAHTPHARLESPRRPESEAGDLAVVLEKLLSFLESAERAGRPGQQVPRREVVDLSSLKDRLAVGETGVSGENPRSRPVAPRKRPSGRQEKPESEAPAHRPSQPAKVFTCGEIKTKVWVNHHPFGQLTWSIQQFRVYRGPQGQMEARSLRSEDLSDAMRGAYQAERWIRKNERRHRLLGWFLGF